MTWTPPKRILTVDAVVFNGRGDLLLIERGGEPFAGHWALPGGIVEDNETIEDAVVRELQEETNAIWPEGFYLMLLKVYSAPGRDPRGPTISCAFTAMVTDTVLVKGGDDARKAEWRTDWDRIPLAFDHAQIATDGWAALGVQRGVMPARGLTPYVPTFNPTLQLAGHEVVKRDPETILPKLSALERRTLKRLYQGIGAALPADSKLMNAMLKKGFVELQQNTLMGTPHWTITMLGRAAISS